MQIAERTNRRGVDISLTVAQQIGQFRGTYGDADRRVPPRESLMPFSRRDAILAALIAIAITGAGGAGCAVDQKKEVEKYEIILRANLLANESPFAAEQPLTLRQALDLANRQNERLAVEGENYL